MILLAVVTVVALLLGAAAGYLTAVRSTPRLLARMSPAELRGLAVRTAAHRRR